MLTPCDICSCCAVTSPRARPPARRWRGAATHGPPTPNDAVSGRPARVPPAGRGETIRVRDGEVLLTDGPFAETKEQVGGYNILECDDRSTAIDVASRHPWAEVGTLELREILDGPPTAS